MWLDGMFGAIMMGVPESVLTDGLVLPGMTGLDGTGSELLVDGYRCTAGAVVVVVMLVMTCADWCRSASVAWLVLFSYANGCLAWEPVSSWVGDAAAAGYCGPCACIVILFRVL